MIHSNWIPAGTEKRGADVGVSGLSDVYGLGVGKISDERCKSVW